MLSCHLSHQLEREEMVVYNVMEDVIKDVITQYQDQLQLNCRCDKCLDDIQALALNEIKPRYITKKEYGPVVRAEHETDRQGATSILSTVVRAASIVSATPRCSSATFASTTETERNRS